MAPPQKSTKYQKTNTETNNSIIYSVPYNLIANALTKIPMLQPVRHIRKFPIPIQIGLCAGVYATNTYRNPGTDPRKKVLKYYEQVGLSNQNMNTKVLNKLYRDDTTFLVDPMSWIVQHVANPVIEVYFWAHRTRTPVTDALGGTIKNAGSINPSYERTFMANTLGINNDAFRNILDTKISLEGAQLLYYLITASETDIRDTINNLTKHTPSLREDLHNQVYPIIALRRKAEMGISINMLLGKVGTFAGMVHPLLNGVVTVAAVTTQTVAAARTTTAMLEELKSTNLRDAITREVQDKLACNLIRLSEALDYSTKHDY